MNNIYDKFMRILKISMNSGMAGKVSEKSDYSDISPEEWGEIFQLAEKQKVMPVIFECVHRGLTPECREAVQFDRLKLQVRHKVLQQALRTEEFFRLNRYLYENGVRPLVVKGIICRSLYPYPDHRASADEDLLIAPEDFALCHSLLTEWGMSTAAVREEFEAAYEVPYRKKGSPLYIELHKSLFPQESEAYGDWNAFFDGVHERAIEEEIQGNTVYTFAHTDHFFYLVCHAFKHFLHSGFGIRQICDMIRYADVYEQDIDWQTVYRNCKQIRADKFVAAVFRIGAVYLDTDVVRGECLACFGDISVDERPMLEDLLAGGIYGSADLNRRHSSNMTLDAVIDQKKGKTTAVSVMKSVFPPAVKLTGRYPYLRKYPWLLPAAWADRLLVYHKESKTAVSSAAEAVKIGHGRIRLLKIYGVID